MPRILRPLILALGAGTLVLVVAFHLPSGAYPEAQTIGSGAQTFQELSDRFQALAQKKGGAYAFEVLKRAVLPPNTDLHLLGHAVGDILYREQGVDGIEVCTQDFRNACSHSIVIGTLNEFGAGDATIQKIRDACEKAPGGPGAYTMCFHGLGHGVFAYFGYDIPKAVAFCKRLGTQAHHELEYQQCVGGMIMELADGGGHDHDQWAASQAKYFETSDPLSPCDRSIIPSDAKVFCYIYLTPHLFEAAGANIGNPDPSTFPRAMSYCDAIADARLRDTCYGSFGKEYIGLAAGRDIRGIDQLSDGQYSLVISWCTSARAQNAREQCVSQALESVFWGGENDPAAAFRFCSLVPERGMQAACSRVLARDISYYEPDPTRRAALCARVPAADQSICSVSDPSQI